MIISREEFHQRNGGMGFDIQREEDTEMFISQLYEEARRDAPFRNHNFMFDGTDIENLDLQEEDGIVKKFPDIKTEKERYEKIREELICDDYESVPVMIDKDYPDVIYLENGFHRVVIAQKMGWSRIRAHVKYGKFRLSKSINFGDLVQLLVMVRQLFPKLNLEEIIKFLQDAVSMKPEMAKNHSIGYGRWESG